jgi:hypothetical protein
MKRNWKNWKNWKSWKIHGEIRGEASCDDDGDGGDGDLHRWLRQRLSLQHHCKFGPLKCSKKYVLKAVKWLRQTAHDQEVMGSYPSIVY